MCQAFSLLFLFLIFFLNNLFLVVRGHRMQGYAELASILSQNITVLLFYKFNKIAVFFLTIK